MLLFEHVPRDVITEVTRALSRSGTLADLARWARSCRAAASASRLVVRGAHCARMRVHDELPPAPAITHGDVWSQSVSWSMARRGIGAWLATLDQSPPRLARAPWYELWVTTLNTGYRWRLQVWFTRPRHRRHCVITARSAFFCDSTSTEAGETVKTWRRFDADVLRADVDRELRRHFGAPWGAVRCAVPALASTASTTPLLAAITKRRIDTAHRNDTLLDYHQRVMRAHADLVAMRGASSAIASAL